MPITVSQQEVDVHQSRRQRNIPRWCVTPPPWGGTSRSCTSLTKRAEALTSVPPRVWGNGAVASCWKYSEMLCWCFVSDVLAWLQWCYLEGLPTDLGLWHRPVKGAELVQSTSDGRLCCAYLWEEELLGRITLLEDKKRCF